MSLSLAQQIHSLLFFKTEPVSYSWLAKILTTKENNIVAAVEELTEMLKDSGVAVINHDESVMLATHPDMAPVIEELSTKEVTTPLTKSALETLAIVLYKGPLVKSEIDYIRGVNSQFMLRNLLVRGLVERKDNPNDKRAPLYQTTHDTLAFLGIENAQALPEYETCLAELEKVTATQTHNHEN